jgi:hypothetical protein
MSTADFLHRYLEPVAMALTPQSARAILAINPTEADVARIAALGQKANDGSLSDEERDEYRTYVDAGDLISILKAKARLTLAGQAGD